MNTVLPFTPQLPRFNFRFWAPAPKRNAITSLCLKATKVIYEQTSKKDSSAARNAFWEKRKAQVMEVVGLIPDTWTVLFCGSEVAEKLGVAVVPPWVKTAISALAVPTLGLLPVGVQILWQHLRHPLNGGLFESVFGAASALGITAVASGLSALGLQNLLQKGSLPHKIASEVVGYTLPWAGYALRLKMPLLARDMYQGAVVSYKIHSVASNRFQGNSAKEVIKELKERHITHLSKLSNDKVGKLDERVSRVYKQMTSWNPLHWSPFAKSNAENLIKDIHERNVVHITSNALDFMGHLLALVATLAAFYPAFFPVVAEAGLSACASLSWLTQYGYTKLKA